MKQVLKIPVVAIVVTIAVFIGASSAAADSANPGKFDPIAAISAVAPAVFQGQVTPAASSKRATMSTSASQIKQAKASDGVIMTSATGSLTIGLPDAAASTTRTTGAGTSYFTNRNGTSVVPVTKNDGSVQIVTVSDSASSPSRLHYSLAMPEGTVMQPLPDGSFAMISGDGKLVGAVAAPWALDANGAAVPTRYEWDGKTLTQVIDLGTAGVAFPVVADPSVTWWWWGYAVKYTKAETKAIYNANTDAQAAALVCGVIPVPQAAAICALVGYIVVTVYFNVWKSAVAHNHCIQVNYSFAPPPYPILIYEVTCDR